MKIAFLFCGQGAQYPGMMKDLFDEIPAARSVFEIADSVLKRGISDICFTGCQEDLNLTHNTQPCVLAADLAAYAAVSAYGIKPDAVAGFSLGEYAGLVAAGVMDSSNAFSLVQKRADYMQEAVPVGKGAMAAVMKLSEDEVRALCAEVDGYVAPANYNSPGQIVVSGDAEAVDQLLDIAKRKRIRAVKLPVSAPFHCELMDSAAMKLSGSLNSIKVNHATIPVYMNVDAQPEMNPEEIVKKLIAQAKSPVRWEQTVKNMYMDGIDTFIEVGPGSTLSGFFTKTFTHGEKTRILRVSDLDSLRNTIAQIK